MKLEMSYMLTAVTLVIVVVAFIALMLRAMTLLARCRPARHLHARPRPRLRRRFNPPRAHARPHAAKKGFARWMIKSRAS
jgi:hypothetical protein